MTSSAFYILLLGCYFHDHKSIGYQDNYALNVCEKEKIGEKERKRLGERGIEIENEIV